MGSVGELHHFVLIILFGNGISTQFLDGCKLWSRCRYMHVFIDIHRVLWKNKSVYCERHSFSAIYMYIYI